MTVRRFFAPLCITAIAFFAANCASKKVPLPKYTATFAGSNGEFGEPFGVAFRNGEPFVSDGENGKIFRISHEGTIFEFASGLHTPSGVAFAANGDLIVADTGTNSIKRIDSEGKIQTVAGVEGKRGYADGDATQALFNGPIGIAVAEDGKIFVADTYNDRIRVIENGKVLTVAGGNRGFSNGIAGGAQFDTPLGIAIWQTDKLLVVDAGNCRIRVIEPDGFVWTLAGTGECNLRDGEPLAAAFVRPTAIAVDAANRIYVADGNSIRQIGGRVMPFVETLTDVGRGFRDGAIHGSQFNRSSGLTIGSDGEIYVADSENKVIRKLQSALPSKDVASGTPVPQTVKEFRNSHAARWPFDPPDAKRDIAGTLGEIRGLMSSDNKQVWFHNGLDIAGQYGETARFIRDEKVLDPLSVENFGTLRELIRLPTLGYIHLRLGRDQNNKTFLDERFQFERSVNGKISAVRIPRGSEFKAGEPIGTLNAMNHVHLIAGRSGSEINALAALVLPNISDSIAPTIESANLYDQNWNAIETKNGDSRIKLNGKYRVVFRAFDRMDGNSERRKLGVYRLGYQILNNDGSVALDSGWNIRFDRMPSNEAVKFAYATDSHSGATGETIFNYIVTNRVNGDAFNENFFDTSGLSAGNYSVRVFAADFFGNVSSKDISIEVIK
ncbi:MAG: hypothetical protein ACRD6X_06810 [Pyrinomonadaceae bacterium]